MLESYLNRTRIVLESQLEYSLVPLKRLRYVIMEAASLANVISGNHYPGGSADLCKLVMEWVRQG